jgi:carbon monoxide dehydrogenase subunit G
MTNLGVFRDDFYNAINVLPESVAVAGPTATATLTAAQLTGAQEVIIAVGNGAGAAQTYTTDTAANIIAALQTAVATAAKANVGGLASSLGGVPPLGVPNLFNVSYTVTFSNQGTTAASALAAGTGVTIAAVNAGMTATAIALGAPNAPVATRYVVTVTGAASVTFTRVQ